MKYRIYTVCDGKREYRTTSKMSAVRVFREWLKRGLRAEMFGVRDGEAQYAVAADRLG